MRLKFEDVNVEYINGEYVDENSFDISVNYINETYNTLRCKAIVIKKFPNDVRVSITYFTLERLNLLQLFYN